jgi:hypothetical protein
MEKKNISFYILYRIDESFDESMFNCCLFNYVPIYILTDLDEGYRILNEIRIAKEKTFIGTLDEFKIHLCSDNYKAESVKLRRWGMQYTHILCTTPIQPNTRLPSLCRDHSEVMYALHRL